MSEQSRQIHYERIGEGPPLLLVHGLGGSSANWKPVLDLLRGERELIVVDTPGHGRTALVDGFVPSAVNVGRALIELCGVFGSPDLRQPDWGHTPTWDDPEGVAALLLDASADASQGTGATSSAAV